MTELLTEDRGFTRYLTLNRPEKKNALNDGLINALKLALAEADREDDLRAIVITGAGEDFCSGADLSALQKISESNVVENLEDAESLMELFLMLRQVRIPVIASVKGRALAGGCGLATACDIVIAGKNASFGYPEVKIGFVPAMVMAILKRNISDKRAFELITRGEIFSAETALNIGLINHTVDDLEGFTEEYAAGYERLSRTAVSLSKKLLYQIDGMTYESAMQAGAEINAIARMTDDCKAGISRFLNKK